MRPNFLHEIESFSRYNMHCCWFCFMYVQFRSLDTVKLIIYMNKDQNESRFLVGITCDSILIAFATANNAAWRNVKPGEVGLFNWDWEANLRILYSLLSLSARKWRFIQRRYTLNQLLLLRRRVTCSLSAMTIIYLRLYLLVIGEYGVVIYI